MTIQITKRDVEEALSMGGAFRQKAMSARETGEYVVGTVAQQVESGAAAFGYGVAEGAYGPIKVGPIGADLAAGAALHACGFFGLFGKYAGHAHNFAQGLVDGYLSRYGVGLGATLRQQGKLPKIGGLDLIGNRGTAPTMIGNRGTSPTVIGARSQPLSAGEIAAMAQQVR